MSKLWRESLVDCPKRQEEVCSLSKRVAAGEAATLAEPGRMEARVVHGFALGLSCNQITAETGLERKRVLRALTCLRRAALLEPPEVFAGTIEVDETYVGGHRRNQRKAQRAVPSKHGRGTSKTPVFGILCREGRSGPRWCRTSKPRPCCH